MDTYVPALMLLSGASFLHSRSNVPELRPASEAADTAWKLLAQFSFLFWLGLLVWGVVMRPWLEPALGFATSLFFNFVLAIRGPRPAWPGLSMVMAVAGIALGAYRLLG
ncbi:multidrug DMT transporter permease [Pseudoroseomonas ludipueritiae]|uniref:Multidrug DMT transporter permease n=1 Tax=Pseudoroseomonas ludipueritiae TaxID=198093 RepID=A0ABR7R3P4_9PROT|nr:multidrug DMT transporter permease [Pseudoroseomonas ludipueritiae]MBC9176267.1 multidrug DMT transporter permease [Pseudoroseomonas ludipueritiae]MCG7361624.1 multidrug DMT transporter permease [Roseomonas sp. ACRSG]